MTTATIKDSLNNDVSVQLPLAPGRAAAASSRPVALSNEDKTSVDAVGTKLDTVHADLQTLATAVNATNVKLDAAVVDLDALKGAAQDTATTNVADDSNNVMLGNAPATVLRHAISIGASADILAGVAGKKIRVLSMAFIVTGAGSVKAQSNNGSSQTDLSGDMPYADKGGINAHRNVNGHFETIAGEALRLAVTGSTHVDGFFTYILV